MKNIKLTLITILTLSTLFVQAQKKAPFEGVITFEITIDSDDLDPVSKAMLADMELKTYLKKEKSRSESDVAMQKSITISDSKAKTIVTLIDIMGQKFMMKTSSTDMAKKEERSENIQVTLLDETKVIAGYTCKKAEIRTPDNPNPITVYYTNDISFPKYASPFRGIDGFPLEYEGDMGGMKTKTTAKSVSIEKVSDAKFVIPEGYQETTMEELQKMFSGGE
ncbi:MAG: DUF4412 domain-containing protein [Bacteroidota bacterium]|nr:DUF4412 domain-containing protein [Bacteroidota bacterium]